ncbi:Ldh family oxidoreductase [Roseomonas sp. 18066]|uniref:Ldh family oxidoreductase n=1 Tax=Roseomonas sp. 18066 TaxID=2681412 RepID=UPI0013585159|nr:Ldh family oxidoreductase [Roseomonas sp. 18066]
MPKTDAPRCPAATIRRQIEAILAAWGMAPAPRATTAAIMVESDLMGIDSHGLSMLPMYEKLRGDGVLRIDGAPRVIRENGCTALLDGGAGLGHPVSAWGMDLATDKALAQGVGIVGVRNSHHFGAAGCYARRAARRGAIGMVMTTARSILAVPARGAQPMLGTNPIAVAAPGSGSDPAFVLDMSSTTAAGNKVKVYALNGWPLPEGWVVDGAGRPVTDAAEGMQYLFHRAEGGLTPLGGRAETAGHKGYGLAMMVQILAGTLTGGALPVRDTKPGQPDNVGHFFLAIDPAAFREPEDFSADLESFASIMRATPAASADEPVLVPGDPERAEHARRLEAGIPVPETLAAQIKGICERAKIEFLL